MRVLFFSLILIFLSIEDPFVDLNPFKTCLALALSSLITSYFFDVAVTKDFFYHFYLFICLSFLLRWQHKSSLLAFVARAVRETLNALVFLATFKFLDDIGYVVFDNYKKF